MEFRPATYEDDDVVTWEEMAKHRNRVLNAVIGHLVDKHGWQSTDMPFTLEKTFEKVTEGGYHGITSRTVIIRRQNKTLVAVLGLETIAYGNIPDYGQPQHFEEAAQKLNDAVAAHIEKMRRNQTP